MSSWTKEQLERQPGVQRVTEQEGKPQFPAGQTPAGQPYRFPEPKESKDRRNQTEQRYEQDHLWPQYQRGEIWDYRFEPLKLRLADNTFYTPDYLVVRVTGIEIVEVKGGFEREDARVKWKTAAERFPWFQFVVARWLGKQKGWKIERR